MNYKLKSSCFSSEFLIAISIPCPGSLPTFEHHSPKAQSGPVITFVCKTTAQLMPQFSS
jgi:hypothetical protein